MNTNKQLIRDGRTLRAMAKRNLLTWPVPVHGIKSNDKGYFPYVDEENRKRSFEYKGNSYRIDYVDGCFFPFVFKV